MNYNNLYISNDGLFFRSLRMMFSAFSPFQISKFLDMSAGWNTAHMLEMELFLGMVIFDIYHSKLCYYPLSNIRSRFYKILWFHDIFQVMALPLILFRI